LDHSWNAIISNATVIDLEEALLILTCSMIRCGEAGAGEVSKVTESPAISISRVDSKSGALNAASISFSAGRGE
jgi:hypothetical protein